MLVGSAKHTDENLQEYYGIFSARVIQEIHARRTWYVSRITRLDNGFQGLIREIAIHSNQSGLVLRKLM